MKFNWGTGIFTFIIIFLLLCVAFIIFAVRQGVNLVHDDYYEKGVDYSEDQSGWYVQGAWQFAPLWRAGLRFDDVDASLGRTSSRSSVMFDYSPSEVSRLRLQYTNDSGLSNADDQWFLQYIMSLGAHGAHQF